MSKKKSKSYAELGEEVREALVALSEALAIEARSTVDSLRTVLGAYGISVNKSTYCCNCKHFYGTEWRVSMEFIEGKPKDGSLSLERNGMGSNIEMCQHPECFKLVRPKRNPERPVPIFVRKRIKGQGQLNTNNNCKYYERKRCKFWV